MNEITPVASNIISNLESYEDFLSFYIQLEEAHGVFAWLKADTILTMQNKLGANSLTQLAIDLKLPPSTVSNYIRAAKAFPSDTRDPIISFSAHLEASFADSYDDKSGVFDGTKRFEWIAKAGEENMSTRLLKRSISESKDGNPEKQNIVKMSHELMSLIGALKDKSIKGDDVALQMLTNIHEQVLGSQHL